MIKINVISNNSLWIKYLDNASNYIDKKVKKLNKKNKDHKKKKFYCTLLLSNSREIKKLNYKFRKKNKPTDILSFPFYAKNDLKKKLNKENEIYLGDIILNLNKIKFKKDLVKFKIEFNKLWIHGLVHLLGYDHKKNKDFLKMSKLEKKFLSYIN